MISLVRAAEKRASLLVAVLPADLVAEIKPAECGSARAIVGTFEALQAPHFAAGQSAAQPVVRDSFLCHARWIESDQTQLVYDAELTPAGTAPASLQLRTSSSWISHPAALSGPLSDPSPTWFYFSVRGKQVCFGPEKKKCL